MRNYDRKFKFWIKQRAAEDLDSIIVCEMQDSTNPLRVSRRITQILERQGGVAGLVQNEKVVQLGVSKSARENYPVYRSPLRWYTHYDAVQELQRLFQAQK